MNLCGGEHSILDIFFTEAIGSRAAFIPYSLGAEPEIRLSMRSCDTPLLNVES